MSSVRTPASPRPRASHVFLATVSEGAELVRAFGHVALVFVEPGAVRSLSGAEGDLVAYGYGGYVLPEIRPRFDKFGPDRVWDAVGSAAFEALSPVVDGTLRVGKMREGFGALRRNVAAEQQLFFDELVLTAEQRNRLHERILDDFERVEPGERKAGAYRYDHFRSNCATRLRDEIFAVLGQDRAHPEHQRESQESFEHIIHESLEVAIASAAGGLRLFPTTWEAGLAMFLPDVPASTKDPRDFLRAVSLVLKLLSSTSIFGGPDGQKVLARAEHLLSAEIPRAPRSRWETLITPRRLRDALRETSNPRLDCPVLAPADLGRTLRGSE